MSKNKLSPARVLAATTAKDQITPGSPEEAYQSVNLAKMLWGFRLRDVDAWQEVIERWATKPVAWERIPEEGTAYGSPQRMIEEELQVDYHQFKEFIRIVLGQRYAAMIEKPIGMPGGQNGNHNAAKNEPYENKVRLPQRQYGTSEEYLRQRILEVRPEVLDQIGKGREYKTVNEAATKLGIVPERGRLQVYSDNPIGAGQYFAERVDEEWMNAMFSAYEDARKAKLL